MSTPHPSIKNFKGTKTHIAIIGTKLVCQVGGCGFETPAERPWSSISTTFTRHFAGFHGNKKFRTATLEITDGLNGGIVDNKEFRIWASTKPRVPINRFIMDFRMSRTPPPTVPPRRLRRHSA